MLIFLVITYWYLLKLVDKSMLQLNNNVTNQSVLNVKVVVEFKINLIVDINFSYHILVCIKLVDKSMLKSIQAIKCNSKFNVCDFTKFYNIFKYYIIPLL